MFKIISDLGLNFKKLSTYSHDSIIKYYSKEDYFVNLNESSKVYTDITEENLNTINELIDNVFAIKKQL